MNAYAQSKVGPEPEPQTREASKPVIVPMLRSDVDIVSRIARESFTTPWTQAIFENELNRDWAEVRVLRSGKGERICGFVNFWIIGEEIHLHNLAVFPSMRRRGYGRALLLDMFQIAKNHSVRTVLLEVRCSNEVAINLYKSVGFRNIAIRPRYYSDNQEDALIMRGEISVVNRSRVRSSNRDDHV